MLSYSSKFKKTCCGKIQQISSFKKSGHPNLELKSAPNTFVCCCQKLCGGRIEEQSADKLQLSADSFRAQVSSSVDQRFKAGTLHNKYCEIFWQCFQENNKQFPSPLNWLDFISEVRQAFFLGLFKIGRYIFWSYGFVLFLSFLCNNIIYKFVHRFIAKKLSQSCNFIEVQNCTRVLN